MKSICKLFAMILFLAGLLMVTSCSKENKDSKVFPKDNKDLILGRWECTRYQLGSEESITTYGRSGVGDIYEFRSDGKLVITDVHDNSTDTYTYSINENILNIGGFSTVIEELTNSKLMFSIEGFMTREFKKI